MSVVWKILDTLTDLDALYSSEAAPTGIAGIDSRAGPAT